MLVKELQHLEEKKIISRTSYPEVPPRVEYALTDEGKSLYKVFGELIAYAKKYPD
jgi:DNA-binding HxlR family transcriptional regulator